VAASVPSRAIGGDFFDYQALPVGWLGFGLGDITGKGRPRRCSRRSCRG
jgi:serine phosphatase RsbU (regulator of sigma subunit)